MYSINVSEVGCTSIFFMNWWRT